jgi:hypothetical protein
MARSKLAKDVPLIADMSVAPEIARLAEAARLVPAQSEKTAPPESLAADTLGTLAGRLRSLADTPERWWGLVRFEPGRSVQIVVEEAASYRAWLVIMPPGDAGRSCDCDVATMIAGEAIDGTPGSAVLRPGPVRVHGQGEHALQGQGTGYSISLHMAGAVTPITEG